jgi:hypothetical protein
MQARPMEDLESSFLRTPTASQGEGGALGEEEARKRGNTVGIRDNALDLASLNGLKVSRAVLPTPRARDSQPEGYEAGLRRVTPQVGTVLIALQRGDDLLPTTRAQNGENRNNKIYARDDSKPQNLENELAVTLLPTTAARDYKCGSIDYERDGLVQTDTVARAIFSSGEVLLPTTRTSMAKGATKKELNAGNPKKRLETEIEGETGDITWGKFEPAIRRWEQTLGRLAPPPTKADGKDGAHRLSSAFTEWMMGLPEGWITGCGLTRNEELKACGNGVVPQQAALALTILKERMLNAIS